MKRLTRLTHALGFAFVLACAGSIGADEAGSPASHEVPPVPAPHVASAGAYQSWKQPPPPLETGPIVDASRLHQAKLDNGLRVVVLEDRRLPRVRLGLAVARGAANETPEEAGLASFLTDVMERGAGDRDALALARAVDGLGASFGVGAGWDSVEASVSGLSRDLDALFAVLADLVLRPQLTDEEATKVRGQILAGLERAKDQPSTLAGWHLARAMYGDHRFGRPLSGTPETVAKLDAAAARRFHASLFVPGHAILYASGDVDPKALMAKAREAFGAWAAGPVPAPGPPPPAQAPATRTIVVVDRPDLVQVQLRVGHDGMRRADPERVAASLMNSTLGGGGFSSRLMTVIREKEGLAYGVRSGFSLRRAGGPFSVGTATRVAEARRALDLILAELEGMQANPSTPEELAHAQTYAAGRFALGLETSGAVLGSLVDLMLHELPEDGLDTYRARVASVTPEEVADQARRRLAPGRAAIVAVGPAETLEPALAELGPVTVVQP